MSEEYFKKYRDAFGETFNLGYFYFQQFLDMHRFRSLNFHNLKLDEKILINQLIIACKESAIIRLAKFFDKSGKAASLNGYLNAVEAISACFPNIPRDHVIQMVKSDRKRINSKSKLIQVVKHWRDKRICHQEKARNYLAEPEIVYEEEKAFIFELRELFLLCMDIIQRYSALYDNRTVAFIFEKKNMHSFLVMMGRYNSFFDLPDWRLCGYVRTLSQYDSTGWLKREIIIKQNDSGFPAVAMQLRVFDKNGVEYQMKTTKGSHRKGHVVIGQAMRLRPWYKDHYDKNKVDPHQDKVVLFPLSDDFMTDRSFYIFTEDEYRNYISEGQSIELERNVWS